MAANHNWPVYGHDWAVDYLRKGMRNDRIRHAYLISGTPSIGKTTLAHAFAMALNCEDDDIEARPCGVCRSCKTLYSGNHPDMLYTETDAGTGHLKIEEVRSLTSRIAMKPYQARYRIAILSDFDHAQPRTQDALLKTLEEPPPQAVLIVMASSLESILPTITSRSQVIHLRPVAADAVRDFLMTNYEVEEEHATLLSRFSGGRIGWAIEAAENPDILQQREEALDLLEEVVATNRAGRFDLANGLGKDKQALAQLLELWLTYWRDVLLATEGSPVKPCNTDRQISIEQMTYSVGAQEALTALRATQTTIKNLSYNVNARLTLEVMFLDYPGLVR
jgi:DNA polymerase III subunit delta'